MSNSTRGANGQYAKNADTAARDAEAARLRTRGVAYREIAKQLGFGSEGAAHDSVQRALAATITEASEAVKKTELRRLDDMWRLALGIAERFHVTVSQGKVVYMGERPVKDDGPALQAIDRLLRIQERRARLLGLDAPVKHEVRNVDAIDAEIEQLMARMAAGGEAAPAAEAPTRADA